MTNINAFTSNVNKDFEDPYAKFAAERDFDLIMRLNWDPDSVTKKEWDALRGDVARDEAQSDWYHNEVAKAKRGEFSLVRQIGNVTRLLIPQWSTSKAYRCEVIEERQPVADVNSNHPGVTASSQPFSDGSEGSSRRLCSVRHNGGCGAGICSARLPDLPARS